MKTVFIIEDDEALAELWAEILRRELTDIVVKTFGDGISALNEIDENIAPDLIILDVILNGPTGFAFLNEIRGYTDTVAIPVIVCSSLTPQLTGLTGYGVAAAFDKTTMMPRDLVAKSRDVLQKGRLTTCTAK